MIFRNMFYLIYLNVFFAILATSNVRSRLFFGVVVVVVVFFFKFKYNFRQKKRRKKKEKKPQTSDIVKIKTS